MQQQASSTGGAFDDPWRRDIRHIMDKVCHLAGVLKAQHLGLLTAQLEQAGYRILANGRDADAASRDGVEYIQIARSCVREIAYQLPLAKAAGLPGRRSHEPLHREFTEIRATLAACIRRTRRR